MRRRDRVFLVVAGLATVAVAAVGAYRAFRLLSIGTAYKAKILCSGLFVAHREPASILNTDLSADDLYLLRHIKTEVYPQSAQVTSSVLGIIESTAKYTPGLGCSISFDSADTSSTTRSAHSAVNAQTAPPAQTVLEKRYDPSFNAALEWAFSEPDPKRLRRTRAVVILHQGRIVAERYAPGFDKDTPLLGWSMTKTVTNALVGILVKQGRVSLEGPVPVPEWQKEDDRRRKITLNHLLRMTSGLRFHEDYGDPLQDVTYMLLGVPDAAAFAAGKPLDAEPGTRWSYSSGTTNIISRIMRRVLGDADYVTFPRKALFDPLGMASAVMERDASGTFVGSSFMYATARDWAKFGQLYLQDGVWQGQRILPEGWVQYSISPVAQAPEKEYGAHVWLKVPGDFSSTESRKLVPADAFHAVGHEGQLLSVLPSRDLVIVRLGLTRHPSAWLHDQFIDRVMKAVPSASD